MTRRHLFSLAAAALAHGQQKRGMIVHSARPEDYEMPLDGFSTWITPVERFFVRSHVYTPQVNAGEWKLSIGGLVEKPLEFTLEQLRRMPKAEVVSVLECAGNGRSLHQPRLIGLQWKYGSVGNARWGGVRLAELLKQAGVKPGAREMACNGADVPIGKMPDFVRSVPLEKCLHPDTLLAYEMNGAPLTASHGFPLRLVAPGWAGDSWMKWLSHLDVIDREYEGFWMKTAYRFPTRPVAPGSAVDAADMKPVQALRVKSVIGSADARTVRGAAWSGEAPVVRVDVSNDSGRTWKPARLGPDRAKYGWRLFEYAWTPPGNGSYVAMARATDAAGETQPIVADWNPSGYLHNAVHAVRVEVGGKPAAEAAPAPVPEFPASVKTACLPCHGADIVAGQRLTRAQWERELGKMVGWGAEVPGPAREEILEFLVKNFGL